MGSYSEALEVYAIQKGVRLGETMALREMLNDGTLTMETAAERFGETQEELIQRLIELEEYEQSKNKRRQKRDMD